MKTLFYHTSGTRFKVGDIIGGHGKKVFLHTNPVPHGTIQSIVEGGFSSWKEYSAAQTIALEEYWDARIAWNEHETGDKPEYPIIRNPKPVSLFVYEMKPYNKPVFGNCNDEYIVYDDFVEVVRIVGNAKGILDNFKRKFGNGTKAWHFGAKARKPNKK
jgi:hypothetical protein